MFIKKFSLFKDNIFSGTIFVSAAIFLSSIFSYFLQYILSKYLTLSDFGTFNALLSLNILIGVFILVFSTSLIKLVSELMAHEQFDKLSRLFWELTAMALLFGVGMSFLFYIFSSELSKIFNISDSVLFMYFGILLLFTLLTAIPGAYLQGLLKFTDFSIFMIVSSFLRFIIPTIFIFAGYKVRGIFLGISISLVLSYLFSLLLLKKDFKPFAQSSMRPYFKELLLFSIPVFFVNIALNMLNNVDIILVKKYFTETDSGLYAGIVTIGKILLFGAGTVSAVMFPQISVAFAKKENFIPKLKLFLIFQLAVTFIGLLFYLFFPEFFVLMFTKRFSPAVPYLFQFSIFMALYVLLNFMVLFLLAVNRTKVFIFLIPGVILQFILITYFHSSLNQVININIGVTTTLLIAVIIYTVFNVRISNNSSI
ncbi:MAG TPA: oligosaccharide flippase family protein [Candidatus Saccharimonadales bacterium]|nr:oligosaccharide flippase family protein [Candidatus Saccharimonadales bacterium]